MKSKRKKILAANLALVKKLSPSPLKTKHIATTRAKLKDVLSVSDAHAMHFIEGLLS